MCFGLKTIVSNDLRGDLGLRRESWSRTSEKTLSCSVVLLVGSRARIYTHLCRAYLSSKCIYGDNGLNCSCFQTGDRVKRGNFEYIPGLRLGNADTVEKWLAFESSQRKKHRPCNNRPLPTGSTEALGLVL